MRRYKKKEDEVQKEAKGSIKKVQKGGDTNRRRYSKMQEEA